MFEDLKKKAARRGSAADVVGVRGEEDTFGSLLTRRRSLDLRFSTVLIR